MWGRSPDISEWRDVVLESTEVAPNGQRLTHAHMHKPPVRRHRDRTYIAIEPQSDQFPPWLSSLSHFLHPQAASPNHELSQAISFPRLMLDTIRNPVNRKPSTCSVLPRDLAAVEIADEQVDAHPHTSLIGCTHPMHAPERGPRWQIHTQRRDLRISVRPGHPAPAATQPAIPAAGESATPSRT